MKDLKALEERRSNLFESGKKMAETRSADIAESLKSIQSEINEPPLPGPGSVEFPAVKSALISRYSAEASP